MGRSLTGELGPGDHLGQQLREIGEVVAEEASLKNKGFTGVGSSQLATKELGFAGDTEGRAAVGVLQ